MALRPHRRVRTVVGGVTVDEPLVGREPRVRRVVAEVVVGHSDRPVRRHIDRGRERLHVARGGVDP